MNSLKVPTYLCTGSKCGSKSSQLQHRQLCPYMIYVNQCCDCMMGNSPRSLNSLRNELIWRHKVMSTTWNFDDSRSGSMLPTDSESWLAVGQRKWCDNSHWRSSCRILATVEAWWNNAYRSHFHHIMYGPMHRKSSMAIADGPVDKRQIVTKG
jgi:hypothetical protein